jgi:signal transduction histidine kinase/CheY-like chemotaxis protein
MPNCHLPLTNFAYSVPVCLRETELESLLAIFLADRQQYIGLVDRDNCLVGIVRDRCLYAHKLKLDLDRASCSPILTSRELPIESPIILSAEMNVSEFLPYLQAETTSTGDTPIYALVDCDKNFVGILDSNSLLKSLLLDRQTKIEPRLVDPENQPNSQTLIQTWQQCFSAIVEQLPLPLTLQTSTGEIVYQNSCWQQQIGENDTVNMAESCVSPSNLVSQVGNRQTVTSLSNPPACLSDRIACQTQFARQDRQLEPQLVNNAETIVGSADSLQLDPNLAQQSRYLALSKNWLHLYQANPEDLAVDKLNSRSAPSSFLATWQNFRSPPTLGEQNQANNQQNWQLLRFPICAMEPGDRSSQKTLSASDTDSFNPKAHKQQALELSNNSLWLVLAIEANQLESNQVLAAKNANLIALNRLKDELVGTLSHELKSPLTAILGLSSLLKEQKLGLLNQRQSRYMELIYSSARQLMCLVNDLFDLARLETGQLQLFPEPLQIKTLCEQAHKQALEIVAKKQGRSPSELKQKFSLKIEPGLEQIVADKIRLCQMLVNLLDNAYKFTPIDREIGIVVSRWANWIAFTVWDSGIGIPEESQHLILRSFSGEGDSFARYTKGKGLGLILTQKLARAQGGDISFVSKVDRGSEFTILVPPSPDRNYQNLNKQLSSCGDRTLEQASNNLVLLIEEVSCYVESLTIKLKELGYHVIVARNGIEALEKARHLQPAKILLHPALSLLCGWDVLTVLKTDSNLKQIPTIVMAEETQRQKAEQYGAERFLSLPIARQTLVEIFPLLNKDKVSDRQSLKILHLYPEGETIDSPQNTHSAEFDLIVHHYLSNFEHRILEADSLEQGDILTRIWNIDVVVLDGSILKDPLAYMRSLSEHEDIASLPLVILDAKTAQIANQLSNLSVFPCLIPDREQNLDKLLEVIQIAAKAGSREQGAGSRQQVREDKNV